MVSFVNSGWLVFRGFEVLGCSLVSVLGFRVYRVRRGLIFKMSYFFYKKIKRN